MSYTLTPLVFDWIAGLIATILNLMGLIAIWYGVFNLAGRIWKKLVVRV